MTDSHYILKIDGIEGESKNAANKGGIDVDSWNFAMRQSITSSGSGPHQAGAVSMGYLNCAFRYNKASPKLSLACKSGVHFKKAVLSCYKAAGGKQHLFYTATVRDSIIASYQTSGSGTSSIPVDQIGLAFTQIEWEYFELKPDGTAHAPTKTGWDCRQKQPI